MKQVFELAPAGGKPFWILGIIVLFLLGMAALFVYFLFSARNTTVELTAQSLEIHGGLYGRSIPLRDLDLERARRVDLTQDRSLGLAGRTNGIGLPGYQAGWFRLRSGEKALVFVTDPRRALYVPTRAGYALLVSVKEPEALLRALGGPSLPKG